MSYGTCRDCKWWGDSPRRSNFGEAPCLKAGTADGALMWMLEFHDQVITKAEFGCIGYESVINAISNIPVHPLVSEMRRISSQKGIGIVKLIERTESWVIEQTNKQ